MKDLNRYITDMWIRKNTWQIKWCLTSLIIREVKIEATVIWNYLSTRKTKIKKSENCKCWQGCGTTATIICYLWWQFLTKLNVHFSNALDHLFWCLWEMKTYVHMKCFTRSFQEALCVRAPIENSTNIYQLVSR